MTLPEIVSERFTTEEGLRVFVQVPDPHAEEIIAAVCAQNALVYGDYDSVSYTGAPGVQRFRSLGSGRNPARANTVTVGCVELSFFLPCDSAAAREVISAIYDAHPYEEPVILVQPCLRTRHVRGMDEDNPNRFWNRAPQDWVPDEHR